MLGIHKNCGGNTILKQSIDAVLCKFVLLEILPIFRSFSLKWKINSEISSKKKKKS